ncbi:MAG TPA: protein-disulfide reductase DsbD domain-containing protein [Stellaceae bacterium]
MLRFWPCRRVPAPHVVAAFALILLLAAAPGGRAVAAPAGQEEGDAAASGWATSEHGAVRLIAASPTAGAGSVSLGLQFRMEPGWKIYWRSPGDAGYPPSLDWNGSGNLADTSVSWPAPRRFSVSGLETVGYEDVVVLPIAATPEHPGGPLSLHLAIDYLTCSQICVPQQATLALDLPAGNGAPGPLAATIAEWLQRVPKAAGKGLRIENASVRIGGGSTSVLDLAVRTDHRLTTPDAFVEGPERVSFGRPEIAGPAGPGAVTLRLPIGGETSALAGQPATVTLVDGDDRAAAVEQSVTLRPGTPPVDAAGLIRIIGVALLGGLILNVMPCVLPVLSLKLLGLVRHGGATRRAVRGSALATAAGIVVSFLLLASVMVGLRAAGVAVGWGIQFQQPAFLAAMAALLALFACNLWGWFEIPLPSALAEWSVRSADAPGRLGDFATGALATLLATPCSAPFVGTAVGFALAGSTAETVAVFAALGIGMALPYLAVGAVPAAASLLPRPGRWMLTVKRLLGVLLAGSAAWLLWILSAQIGLGASAGAALLVAVAAALIGFGALAGHNRRRHHAAGTLRRRGAPAALAGAVLVAALAPPPAAAPAAGAADGWTVFDRDAVERLVGEGRTVFVDVTADWCVTCQVNKRLVLDKEPVRALLARPDTVAMRADWTRPDETIAGYLRSFGRYGIPFNAVYGPGAPGGLPLPELLTESDVVAALRKAAGAPDRGGATAAAPAVPDTEVVRHGG